MTMEERRPLFKRAKFVAMVIAAGLLAGSYVANALAPGAVEAGVQSILSTAIAGFFVAQGYVDGARAKASGQTGDLS
jgi:hypothetical protein